MLASLAWSGWSSTAALARWPDGVRASSGRSPTDRRRFLVVRRPRNSVGWLLARDRLGLRAREHRPDRRPGGRRWRRASSNRLEAVPIVWSGAMSGWAFALPAFLGTPRLSRLGPAGRSRALAGTRRRRGHGQPAGADRRQPGDQRHRRRRHRRPMTCPTRSPSGAPGPGPVGPGPEHAVPGMFLLVVAGRRRRSSSATGDPAACERFQMRWLVVADLGRRRGEPHLGHRLHRVRGRQPHRLAPGVARLPDHPVGDPCRGPALSPARHRPDRQPHDRLGAA